MKLPKSERIDIGKLADEIPILIREKNLDAEVFKYNINSISTSVDRVCEPLELLQLIDWIMETIKKCFSSKFFALKEFSQDNEIFLIIGAWNIAEATDSVLNYIIKRHELEYFQERYKCIDAVDLREKIEKDLTEAGFPIWNPFSSKYSFLSRCDWDETDSSFEQFESKYPNLINQLKNEKEQYTHLEEYTKREFENYLHKEAIIKIKGIVLLEEENRFYINLFEEGKIIWVPKSAILLKKNHIQTKSYKYDNQNFLIDVIYEYKPFQTFIIDSKEIKLKPNMKKTEHILNNHQEGTPIEIIVISNNSATIRLMLSYFESIQLIFKGFTSCDEALKELETNLAGTILLDDNLPDESKSKFLKKLKSDERLKHIPIRLFSKKFEENDKKFGSQFHIYDNQEQ